MLHGATAINCGIIYWHRVRAAQEKNFNSVQQDTAYSKENRRRGNILSIKVNYILLKKT